MKTVVFQGDSVTDACTVRDDDTSYGVFGCGYPLIVAARAGYEHPGKYKFINKGFNGKGISDLYAEINDCISLKPDILTILIGANDVLNGLSCPDAVDKTEFFDVYCRFLEEFKAGCPECEILIIEPFVLKTTDLQEHWNTVHRAFEMRAADTKKVAERYNIKFLSLQEKFDSMVSEKIPAEYWLTDGIHPTSAGHGFIAEEVIRDLGIG